MAVKRKPKLTPTERRKVNNIVYISDTHCGCQLALCPPVVHLDNGGTYRQSAFQKKVYRMWRHFWDKWVPMVTEGEPFAVVHNGDAIDGSHHRATTQITHNLEDQEDIAYELLKPIVEVCEGRYYHIRGTEAHVGQSAENEESLAKRLCALPNKEGQYARYDLWKKCGPGLVQSLHHIGSTGSQAYESTAVHKELVEAFIEAGRWNGRRPDVIVRSHRHRMFGTEMPGDNGMKRAVVTPAWQGKTGYVWKLPGARLSTPQFGGVIVRYHKGELYYRAKVWTVDPSEIEE